MATALRRRILALGGALSLAALGPAGWAHGLEANRVELVLHGDTVEAVATPPVSFVASADTNGDGLLSRAEVAARRDELRRTLVAALGLTDPEGRGGSLVRADVSVPRSADGAAGGEYLRVTVRWRWPAPLRALRVRCDFVREHPVTLYATRAETSAEGRLTLVGAPEQAVLSSRGASVTVLRVSGGGLR